VQNLARGTLSPVLRKNAVADAPATRALTSPHPELRSDFEYPISVVFSPIQRDAVDVILVVHDAARTGTRSVGIAKGIQHRLSGLRHSLE
jgi:hypothetical protein